MAELPVDGSPTPAPDWRKLHAFGWPAGSVRALMAILIFGSLWGFLVVRPDREVPESLRDLLFIVLGHYFAVRSRQPAGEEPGPPPLHLPRGSVRLFVIAGCIVVAVLLYRRGHLLSPGRNPGVVTLLLVFGFLLGVVVQQIATVLGGGRRALPRLVEDVRAFISLAAAVLLVVLVWDQLMPYLPVVAHKLLARFHFGLGPYGPENVLAAVVGFYFGTRS